MASASAPATEPAAAVFENKDGNIRLTEPADWTPKDDKDYVLALVPKQGKADAKLTVDVPDLPPHLPGMITIRAVEHGFVSDLKEQMPDLKITQDAVPASPPTAKCKRVTATGHEKGKEKTVDAVLMIHADRVIILKAEAASSDYPAAKAGLESMLSSLKWTK